jgi:hypothetical protein
MVLIMITKMTTDDPRYRFLDYCKSQGLPCIAVDGADPSDPKYDSSAPAFRLDFADSATQPQIDQTNEIAKAGSFPGGWTPQPLPDLASFQQALFADSTLTASAKTQLLTLMPVLQANINNATLVQQFWADLKGESLPWLDAKTISTVEGYASTYAIPLVGDAASQSASTAKTKQKK